MVGKTLKAYSNALAGLSSALKNWDDSRKESVLDPGGEFLCSTGSATESRSPSQQVLCAVNRRATT